MMGSEEKSVKERERLVRSLARRLGPRSIGTVKRMSFVSLRRCCAFRLRRTGPKVSGRARRARTKDVETMIRAIQKGLYSNVSYPCWARHE